MTLAFGQIHDAGKDPGLFHKAGENMFPELKDPSLLQELHELYRDVSDGSPDYKSKNRKRNRPRQAQTEAGV